MLFSESSIDKLLPDGYSDHDWTHALNVYRNVSYRWASVSDIRTTVLFKEAIIQSRLCGILNEAIDTRQNITCKNS